MKMTPDTDALARAIAWLPRHARIVAAIGWSPTDPETAAQAADGGRTRVWHEWPADSLHDAGTCAVLADAAEGFDAVVWRESPVALITRPRLQQARARLQARGTLVLLRPIERAAWVSEHDALRDTVQNLVLLLSELGFVLRRERVVSGAAGADAVLVARRDAHRVRPYRREDRDAIRALFTTSFHTTRTPEAWRWRFEQHPFGHNKASVATDRDGGLVGHYAGLPFHLTDARASPRRTYDALQMCDIMTAPSVRRLGLGPTAMITRLWRHFYAAHAEHRVAFVIGFNTASSRGMAMRFHRATELERITAWRRATDGVPRDVARYRVRPITDFNAATDRLFARVAPAYGALVERRRTYLSWRYRARPDVAYLILGAYRWRRLVAWGAFRRDGDTLLWGDALCDPQHVGAAEALVATAVARQATPPSDLFAWFPSRPAWWCDALRAHGWRSIPEPNDLSLIYGMHNAPEAEAALRAMYYTMGDSDLF